MVCNHFVTGRLKKDLIKANKIETYESRGIRNRKGEKPTQ